ncbi:MAG: ATP-binding protein [Hyphomonadaceae bacterium]|nr:ATP-binding protein [Hyphomonadaceae bacterium]
MRALRLLRFRTQVVAVIIAAVTLTVIIGYGGLTAFGAFQEAEMIKQFSEPAQRAIARLEAQKIPAPADLEALIVEGPDAQADFDFRQNVALAVLSVISALIGSVTGAALSARFSRPIEDVARAVRAIAAGDLTARAPSRSGGSGETVQLIQDFNAMAAVLERTDRELRESSAAIAHELRTPLTVLRGRLQGISDGVFGAGPKEIDSLIRQVDALAAIVEDLRVVSLAAVGALKLNLSELDLAETVDAVATSVRPDLEAAGMGVELDLAPAHVHADAARIQQVVGALTDNAIRYAGEGGQLRIEVGQTAAWAFIRVLDRGPGFAKADLPRLFDRFWRADASRSRAVGGSGLGLSVVKSITEAHGGACLAANRENGGAVLEVRLPR